MSHARLGRPVGRGSRDLPRRPRASRASTCATQWLELGGAIASKQAIEAGVTVIDNDRPQALRGCHQAAARRDARRSAVSIADRADRSRAMSDRGPDLQQTPSERASADSGRRKPSASWRRCARCRSAGASCSIAALNTIVAIICRGRHLGRRAGPDARRATSCGRSRESDRLLALLESQVDRLQNLIHRYFTQPNDDLLKEITDLRDDAARHAGQPRLHRSDPVDARPTT